MTLLESVVALVILALSAVGALQLFQETARSASQAQEWTVAASYAEQGLEAAKLGPSVLRGIERRPMPSGYSRVVTSERASHGLVEVTVNVAIPGGAVLSVHRLVHPP